MRSSRSGILPAKPPVKRVVISRRKTPDLVQGSRNLTELSVQMFAPRLSAAHASVSESSILLANSGGVNTSSLERFAMHDSTSGLRPRSEKLSWPVMWPRLRRRRAARKQFHSPSSADRSSSA